MLFVHDLIYFFARFDFTLKSFRVNLGDSVFIPSGRLLQPMLHRVNVTA